jgi:hypothetical protein
MSTVGIAQAARLAGVNQSTMHRAMRAGKLSYTTDAAGKRRIDVAELGRVFAIKMPTDDDLRAGNGALSGNGAHTVQGNDRQYAAATVPAGEIAALQARISEQAETIRALWQRLDKSEAERERIQERLTGLLTHRQAGSVPAASSSRFTASHVPWWRWWFR